MHLAIWTYIFSIETNICLQYAARLLAKNSLPYLVRRLASPVYVLYLACI